MSRFIHELIWDTIEDEELIKKADRAYAEFLKILSYSLEEVMRVGY